MFNLSESKFLHKYDTIVIQDVPISGSKCMLTGPSALIILASFHILARMYMSMCNTSIESIHLLVCPGKYLRYLLSCSDRYLTVSMTTNHDYTVPYITLTINLI